MEKEDEEHSGKVNEKMKSKEDEKLSEQKVREKYLNILCVYI